MLHGIQEGNTRIATECEKQHAIDNHLSNLNNMFADVPVVLLGNSLYGIVNGVAYPIQEMAERSESPIICSSQKYP